jgi:hypothetical protein
LVNFFELRVSRYDAFADILMFQTAGSVRRRMFQRQNHADDRRGNKKAPEDDDSPVHAGILRSSSSRTAQKMFKFC